MRWVVGDRAISSSAASASQMGRFEMKWLSRSENLAALADLNALRSHSSELGIVTSLGVAKVSLLIEIVRDNSDTRLPEAARPALCELSNQIEALTGQIVTLENEIRR
jgi:hypothetical protein